MAASSHAQHLDDAQVRRAAQRPLGDAAGVHLVGCPACAARVGRERERLANHARRLGAAQPDLWDDFRRTLEGRAPLGERSTTPARAAHLGAPPSPPGPAPRWLFPTLGALVALAVLVAFGVLFG